MEFYRCQPFHFFLDEAESCCFGEAWPTKSSNLATVNISAFTATFSSFKSSFIETRAI